MCSYCSFVSSKKLKLHFLKSTSTITFCSACLHWRSSRKENAFLYYSVCLDLYYFQTAHIRLGSVSWHVLLHACSQRCIWSKVFIPGQATVFVYVEGSPIVATDKEELRAQQKHLQTESWVQLLLCPQNHKAKTTFSSYSIPYF